MSGCHACRCSHPRHRRSTEVSACVVCVVQKPKTPDVSHENIMLNTTSAWTVLCILCVLIVFRSVPFPAEEGVMLQSPSRGIAIPAFSVCPSSGLLDKTLSTSQAIENSIDPRPIDSTKINTTAISRAVFVAGKQFSKRPLQA